jgi:putative nucleotidyltransferase with HDIG domain
MSRNILESASAASDPGGPSSGFGPKKIRTKIFLLVTGLLVTSSAFILLYFTGSIERRLTREIARTIDDVSAISSLGLVPALATDDKVSMEQMIKVQSERLGRALYMVLEDESGQVLASVNRDVADQDIYRDTDALEGRLAHRKVYRTKTPVAAGDRTLGNLFIGYSFNDLIAAASRDKGMVTAVCLLIVGVGGLVAFLFTGLVTRPLVQVTRTAEKIAKGDLTQRAKVFTRDEVGLLARTFNTMVDGLESSFRQMEASGRSLEDKLRKSVLELERESAERRRIEQELRLANNELEHSVDKRTEALSKVNEELHGRVMETRRSEDQLQFTLARLEKALEGTVRAMSLTIEMRDLYTAGHQRRVTSLAVAIAEDLHLPQEKIEGLRLAGIIHDIGKIAMPAELLTKPTRLTKTEFQLLKDHPRIGYDILKNIQFPWPVAHIILQHHERMDGTGYPEGLVGEAILIEARILAVADVVEALSSHRPYRPALGIEKALEEIRRGRGSRYDMRVADACMKLFKDRRYSFQQESSPVVFQ